jgi:predicted nucleotidyltransferase
MESVYSTKQIKLFGKIFQEFLDNYHSVLGVEKKVFKVKKAQVLQIYLREIKKVEGDFLDCKDSALEGITILKANCITGSINWEYLHNLYFIVNNGKISPEVLERSKKGLESGKNALVLSEESSDDPEVQTLTGGIEGLMQSDLFGDLLKDMSGDVGKMLEGKDLSNVNPMDLMSGLLDPNNTEKTVGGINFSEIINKTVASLKGKIENKEIDVEQLKSIAGNIAGNLQKKQ